MRSGIVGLDTHRKLSVSDFRGFAISDEYAPVVFINTVDALAAQVFTLAHELGHIWIGASGISNADPRRLEVADDVEAFCNAVAGEVLLPWAEAGPSWEANDASREEWIRETARRYHVSTVMVARQLWGHGAISRDDFFTFYDEEAQGWQTSAPSASGGNFYASTPIRNSRLFTESVLESVSARETSPRDASQLLGVKPAKLAELRRRMGLGE
jgi:Zn-dependent peptidase ImmA (M78 family)